MKKMESKKADNSKRNEKEEVSKPLPKDTLYIQELNSWLRFRKNKYQNYNLIQSGTIQFIKSGTLLATLKLFVNAKENELKINLPTKSDEIFLIESIITLPWISDINGWILEKTKLTFSQLLDKIENYCMKLYNIKLTQVEAKEIVTTSDISHLSSKDDENPEVEEEEEKGELDDFNSFMVFSTREPQKAKKLEKMVESVISYNGFDSVKVDLNNGTILIKLFVDDILNSKLANQLNLNSNEPLLITLDYSQAAFHKESPPNISLRQPSNKKLNNLVAKSIVCEFVQRFWKKEYIHRSELGFDEEEEDKPITTTTNETSNFFNFLSPKKKMNYSSKVPQQVTKKIKISDDSVSQLTEMGFDQISAKIALETCDNNVQEALNKLLQGDVIVTPDIQTLMEMGFGFNEAQTALLHSNGDVQFALDHIFQNPVEQAPVSTSLYSSNSAQVIPFLQALVEFLKLRLKNITQFCCICYKKHCCNRMAEKPVVCSTPLCMFRYEELGMGVSQDLIYLCPFSICPAKFDPNDKIMNSLIGNDVTKDLTLDTLLQMYESKYSFPKYLPHNDMLKFVREGLRQNNMKVSKITNVLKIENVFKFEAKWKELIEKRGKDNVKPQMVYHGTNPANIPSILAKGLLVPGTSTGIAHATDNGYWGEGIYLSPNPGLSVGYCRGGNKLLICSVLMGKVFKCTQLIHGAKLTQGYDSHEDPSGNEWIVFDSSQVLVCYVVEFGS